MTVAAEALAFEASRARFEATMAVLSKKVTMMSHSELENFLSTAGRDLQCQLYQDSLTLLALLERRINGVVDAKGVLRNSIEHNHQRPLTTIFGDVEVSRLAYRQRGHDNLYPVDALLNLPSEQYSLGLRRLAAIEASRGSFEDAAEAIERITGVHLGKRQVEELAHRAAVDFHSFYDRLSHLSAEPNDLLVLSADGKGIVMRPEALRDATAKAAISTGSPPRLSKGEKRNRKRMAEVGSVYDAAPVPRTPQDILTTGHNPAGQTKSAPVAKNKWLTASVVEDAKTVISQVFDEAQRRDPEFRRTWVVLVDGNNHQLDCINAQARARGVSVNIIIDFIHVLEYVWKAAHSFFKENDPAAEIWVAEKATAILSGQSSTVAAAIRRKATCLQLNLAKRQGADDCADYLLHKTSYLKYDVALEKGWPIATGIIEGACKTLVKDRFDITGARWGLDGAETILKLRALRKNGDFEEYWRYHIAQECHRIHETRYKNGIIPTPSFETRHKTR
jgi:hypothetical protein